MNSFLPKFLREDILAINFGTLTKKQLKTIKEKSLVLCSEILWFILHEGDLYEYTSISMDYMRFYVKNNNYTNIILDKFLENLILLIESNSKGTAKYSAGNNGYKAFSTKYKLNPKYFPVPEKTIFDLIRVNEEVKIFNGNYKHIERVNSQEVKVVKKVKRNAAVAVSDVLESGYPMLPKTYIKNPPLTLVNTTISEEKKYDKNLTKIINKMKEITIKPTVYDFIKNYKISEEKMLINEEAIKMAIKPFVEFDDSYLGINWLFEKAKLQNKDLIVVKNKAYIEDRQYFIDRKSLNSQIHMLYTINMIDNRNVYAKRNDNNRRLDSNITNMKSALRDYILIDGEEVEELDIANAQFAILAYLYPNKLDKDFIELTQTGKLYQHIGDNLYDFKDAYQRKAKAKMLMIQTAFSRSESWQNPLRQLFPKTMVIIDKGKENDHKEFSKLLQNTESKIIIDGLLPKLMKKYNVFTIHDAFLVKKSESKEIKEFIDEYFKSIGFKCFVRGK